MSRLATNLISQFIPSYPGLIHEIAKIYPGKVNTDGLNLDNCQDVYLERRDRTLRLQTDQSHCRPIYLTEW